MKKNRYNLDETVHTYLYVRWSTLTPLQGGGGGELTVRQCDSACVDYDHLGYGSASIDERSHVLGAYY